jgi:hypothetical protein
VVGAVVNRRQRGGLLTADAESISQQGGGAQGEIRPSIKKREEREKGVGAQTDSQQFKRWFADSKVVDENGEPLVVYRGSPYDPLAQEAGKGVIKPEAYFTADPEYASRYTGNGGKVGAYYLNIRRPFDSFKFLDKGAESQVYVGEHSDKVLKVRKLSPYSLDGVKSELAKIVYHNYLFPKDAYTLRDIAVWDNNGYDQFYLILEQPLVTPKTDAAGNIIAPSEGQIFEALNKTKQRFRIYDEAWDRQGAEEFDTTDSDDSSADFVPSARKIAYNGQFMVYDFKPGRNTFIDAETGEVRFIDPRVDINDPGAGFSVSTFGKRKIASGPVSFEGAPSGDMEGGDLRLSRGGYKPGDWRKTFTFGKAARGAAEQTNGGLAAGEERRRWEENPVDERIPEWDAPARNPNVAKPFALSSAEGVRLVKLLGGTMKKPKAYKDAIGVIDESDEQRIREDLKAMGFFKSDDYLWAATSDPATVAADRADSQAALDARLEKLGEQRLKGEAGGGNRGLVRVSMSQVADLVLSLPAETGGNLGNVRTLAQGIVRGFEKNQRKDSVPPMGW